MKTVLVTGASSGIGAASALELARRGVRVLAGVRRAADGEALEQRAPRGMVVPVLLDVTDPAAIARVALAVEEATGDAGLHGLVNNAGICCNGPLECLPLEVLRRQLEVNVVGALAVTQALLPALQRGRGRIVFVGSLAGRLVSPLVGSYAASKAALAALADALRMELRDASVSVSLIEAGGVATGIWDKARSELAARLEAAPAGPRSRYQLLARGLGRLSAHYQQQSPPPERVARTVALALTARRPKSRYLPGQGTVLGRLLALLPDRLRDSLFLREYQRAAR